MKGIFLDGAMKKKALSLLGRLIKPLPKKILSKILFGTKSRTQQYGRKSQPFYGIYVKTKSSHGTFLGKGTITGPSYVPTEQEEESTKHLMHSCHLACKLWEKVSFRCKREGRVQGDIIATIHNWDRNPFKRKILNF